MSLLCVLTASPRTLADVHLLSRRMLAMRASADALLALCDLPGCLCPPSCRRMNRFCARCKAP